MATSSTYDNEYIPEEEEDDEYLPVHEDRTVRGTKKKSTKVYWSLEEKNAVMKELGATILLGTVPGKVQCENCIKKSKDALSNRTWRQIKYYAKNYITSKKINAP